MSTAIKKSRALFLASSLTTRPALFAAKLLLPQWQSRNSSHSPMGPSGSLRKKVTLNALRSMHKKGEPIAVITAHDFPSGYVADAAGMDVILVGDSLAMVALGMEDTSEVLVEEMILHCRSVSRAAKAAFTVCEPTATSNWDTKTVLLGRRSTYGFV
jgi:3-methyl-2-oxobutanoate hydroxymethyltransferase